MKPHTFFCFAIVWMLLLTNCIGSQHVIIQGDGNIITREIPVSKFHSIKIGGDRVTVNYTQGGNKDFIKISADQNILSLFDIEVKNNILQIQPKKEIENNTLRPTRFIVEVSSEQLENIQTFGSSNFNLHSSLQTEQLLVEVKGSSQVNLAQPVEYKQMMIKISGSGELNSEDLNGIELFGNISGSGSSKLVAHNHRTELKVSGSGRFHIMELNGKELACSISGSGGAYINGEIRNADLNISGSGFMDAKDLRVDHALCKVSGSGTMEIQAIHNLEATVSGSGTLGYKGDPFLLQHISGSGKLRKVEN